MTFNQFMVGFMAAFVIWSVVEQMYCWALLDLAGLIANVACVIWRSQDNG